MHRFLIIAIFSYLFFPKATAQKNSIGVNLTSLISEVISLGDDDELDNFDVLYTRYGNTSNFRLGLNAFYKNDSDLGNFGNTTLSEERLKMRAGFEKKKELSSKFMLCYGIDILGGYESSSSSSDTGLKVDKTIYLFGGGPSMRFEFRLNKWISLMTESTLYFTSGNKRNVLLQNGIEIDAKDTKFSEFKTTIPSLLYLNIHF